LAGDSTPSSEGDAVVVTRRGVAVGIITADCAPVLLRDLRHRAVAAVHAGWRGAAAGVLEATLATLHRTAGVEPHDVEAVIGPAAGGCCYEVGDDVRRAFDQRAAAAFVPRRDRHMFDLRAAVEALAVTAGMARVERVGPCTICDPAYASYRRDGQAAGRQLSFIALT
jgi:YfiH family protein